MGDKFEKVTLEIPEKYKPRVLGAQKYLQDSYEVLMRVDLKKPSWLIFVTITGDLHGVQSAIDYIEVLHQDFVGEYSFCGVFRNLNYGVLRQLKKKIENRSADSDSSSDS